MAETHPFNPLSVSAQNTASGSPMLAPAIFKLMADNAPVIMLLLDTQGIIHHVNPYFEQLTGYSLDEVKGRDWFTTCLPARDQQRIRTLFKSATHDVPTRGNLNPIVTRSGEERLIEWNDQAMRDEHGQITSLIAIGQDVTARRLAEEAVRSSEMRLNEAQRIAQVGSWEFDAVNNVLTWSDEIFRLFEIGKANFGATYEAFLNAIHPDDRDTVHQAYTGSLQTRAPYEITHRLRMGDGRIKWVEERCVSDFDAEGKPLQSRGTVQDITARKQAETAIIAAKDQLKATLDAIPDLLFEAGLDGRYYDYHSPRTDLLAAPAHELIGKKVSDILPPAAAEVAMSALQDAFKTGWSQGKQFELQLPQGNLWFELSIARK